jgi:hypothetical protein
MLYICPVLKYLKMKKGKVIKRTLLTFILGCLIVTMSYGQAALLVLILGDKVATEKFHLSIDGALSLSSLENPGLGKNSLGVNFGLGTHLKLGEKWFLQVDFKPLSQKGAKSVNAIVAIPADISESRTSLKLNYIDVPALIQYKICSKLLIAAGPQISFLTSASQNSEGVSSGSTISAKQDIKSFFNNIDYSIAAELRYSFSIKRKGTRVDIDVFTRYNYGLTDIFKDSAVGSAKTSNFQFGLSFPFIKSPEELEHNKKD